MIMNPNMLLAAYPVGSLYLTTNEINPGTLFGGTWEKLTGDAYLKIVTSNPGQYDGTSSDHKIPIASIPSHNHGYTGSINGSLWGQGTGYGRVSVGTSTGADRANIGGIAYTGGGNAYYPYYYGIYVWRRTA